MLGNTSVNHPDSGVVVIVGGGQTPGENEAMVAELGAVAIEDNTSNYAQALRIRKYPSFIVVNSSNKVVHEDQSAIQWMDESFGFSL